MLHLGTQRLDGLALPVADERLSRERRSLCALELIAVTGRAALAVERGAARGLTLAVDAVLHRSRLRLHHDRRGEDDQRGGSQPAMIRGMWLARPHQRAAGRAGR